MKFVVTGVPGLRAATACPLGSVAGEQLAGAEPGEVELLGRVGEGRSGAGRLHLVPARVVLAPHRPAPGLVQPVELAVARPEPVPECLRREFAVTGGDVAAVFVADVPHGDGRMPGVSPRHPFREVDGGRAECRGARAVVLARAGPESFAVHRDRQDLRVRGDEPGRRRRVPVARSTPIPASASRSRTRSSQPTVSSPGAGCSLDQEKTPTVTRLTPASAMSRMSSAQVDSGHCSGL